MTGDRKKLLALLPVLAALAGIAAFALWWLSGSSDGLRLRIPGTDAGPAAARAEPIQFSRAN